MPLLPIDTEVQVLKLGPQRTCYSGLTGRVIGHKAHLLHIILDNDPVPHWRNLGILCYPEEVRSIDDCE